jgi:hypothetical protein
VQLLGLFRTVLQLRSGVAFPVAGEGGAELYIRAGLPF